MLVDAELEKRDECLNCKKLKSENEALLQANMQLKVELELGLTELEKKIKALKGLLKTKTTEIENLKKQIERLDLLKDKTLEKKINNEVLVISIYFNNQRLISFFF